MPPAACGRRAPTSRRRQGQLNRSATRSPSASRSGADMPITPTDKIWMNGELVPWNDAKVHVLTHTLHYGMGVFEGIRAYETSRGPAVFRLTDHIARLHNSARILMMELPYSVDEPVDAVKVTWRPTGLPGC